MQDLQGNLRALRVLQGLSEDNEEEEPRESTFTAER